ncbi:DUF523 domain-containing protein [Neiella marina]|uniref:DUF523 domain-containing protein n=1 Tax=Neiella holothuriorum TaxID=2870530 RepID=A0ABS7EC44_9GAMM|nr:DUF523 domain-containing protein [Neiella holothuriorum]MBW8189903.1 DUF523 domain-containing protein [Neiella holothuriorum]
MEKILVSGCLMGQAVRYDGLSKAIDDAIWCEWLAQGRLISVCPEVAGGLPVPRAKAEQQADGRVFTEQGADVSSEFTEGAQQALALATKYQIKFAILKANSPSCGNQYIYDGTFTGQLIEGAGITARLLQQAGIEVFNEHQLQVLQSRLAALETGG